MSVSLSTPPIQLPASQMVAYLASFVTLPSLLRTITQRIGQESHLLPDLDRVLGYPLSLLLTTSGIPLACPYHAADPDALCFGGWRHAPASRKDSIDHPPKASTQFRRNFSSVLQTIEKSQRKR